MVLPLLEEEKMGDFMKITVVPSSNSYGKVNTDIVKYKEIGAKAFIFGLKDFSSGYDLTLDISDIIDICERNQDVEIFVAVNKNIFNDEVDILKDKLILLDKAKVAGILFYDLAVLSLKEKLKLNVPLVWNQTHMVTNYNTCNYYYDKGVEYGVLAGEITLNEMNEISSRTKMGLFAHVFGYPIMSYTRRSLLSNYFISNNKKKEKDSYTIKNNGESYTIKEENNGNAIYYGKLLNLGKDVLSLSVSYIILDENGVDHGLFEEVVSLYSKILDNDLDASSRLSSLVGDDKGFFYKSTIYKVKKNG